jgi:valyl-tRNA synthetase
MNVPAGAKIPLLLVAADPESGLRLERYQAEIDRLARLEYSTTAAEAPPGAVVIAFEAASIALPIADVIDIVSERIRLEKEYKRLAADIAKIETKLGNPEFLKRAPEEVVAEQHERLADTQARRAKVGAALARLETISG